MNATELHDFDQQVDAMKADLVWPIVMSPKLWTKFATPPTHTWNWNSVPFQRNCSDSVPDDKHGVYTFAIAPGVAEHPLLYLVTYVGKAGKMTLRARFLSYFNEKRNLKRPHIGRFLRQYEGFIMFSFCPIEDVSTISQIEDELINALIPPLNRKLPAKVSAMVRAFH